MINLHFEDSYMEYDITIVPKKMITVKSRNTYNNRIMVNDFRIGDYAEYDSYNLSYLGPIQSITEKTVTIRDISGKNKRLKIYNFAWRNGNKTISEKQSENQETMMYI
jgi:hypothetical protein